MHDFSAKTLASMALVASLLCASCASTQRPEAEPVPVGPDGLPVLTDAQADQGIVCERTRVVGSRISTKTCTTPEQRERNQQLGREQAEQAQRLSKGAGPTAQ